MHEIEFTPRALQDLDRLPEKVGRACLEFIHGALALNPHRVGKPLHGELRGQHSARRGTYRVVYRIDGDTVRINRVDHRRDVYR